LYQNKVDGNPNIKKKSGLALRYTQDKQVASTIY